MEEVSSEAGCTGEAPPTLESQKQAVLAILVGSLAMGRKSGNFSFGSRICVAARCLGGLGLYVHHPRLVSCPSYSL